MDESYDEVFRHVYPKAARTAFLMLGHTGEAEEAAQDAFLALLTRWDTVDNPSAFVMTATIHRCRDIGRRRSLQQRTLSRMRPTERSDEPEYLLDALQRLHVRDRELIVLRYFLDHTVPEIADLLRVPDGTVKSRLHRALRRLHAQLR